MKDPEVQGLYAAVMANYGLKFSAATLERLMAQVHQNLTAEPIEVLQGALDDHNHHQLYSRIRRAITLLGGEPKPEKVGSAHPAPQVDEVWVPSGLEIRHVAPGARLMERRTGSAGYSETRWLVFSEHLPAVLQEIDESVPF